MSERLLTTEDAKQIIVNCYRCSVKSESGCHLTSMAQVKALASSAFQNTLNRSLIFKTRVRMADIAKRDEK